MGEESTWRDAGDTGSVPGWRRPPGGGHDNPLQYSCLENPMDRRTWWATVHWVAKESDKTEQLSMQAGPLSSSGLGGYQLPGNSTRWH